jgi:ribonucleoside-triphosphate reductase
VGATGILQGKWIQEPKKLGEVYNAIEEADVAYSRELGISTSIKLTTVKPSGTSSLLPGVTPGIHPAFSKYYIRRIRFSSDDPLVDVCRSRGFATEPVLSLDGSRDLSTTVVSFPCVTPADTILAKDMSAIRQLEYQALVQGHWSDNSVSATCYYRPEELPAIKQYLRKNYSGTIKSVSFLLHKDHGFDQAPYEEISEEEYLGATANVQDIRNIVDEGEFNLKENLECAGGSCPVK